MEDKIDRQEKEFKMLGIKELFRGPLVLTLLSLSVIYIVYQHNRMLNMLDENRVRESELQQKIYSALLNNIKPDLEDINKNIQRANSIIDSVTTKTNGYETK